MERATEPPSDPRCDRCGGFATVTLGDRQLCEECCSVAGSCCLEFGADDLWTTQQDPQD